MKGILAILVVFGALLVIGCTTTGGTNANIKDCGSDLTCFGNSFASCELAKVLKTDSANGFTASLYGEIKGGTSSNCSVYVKVNDLTAPTNATNQEKIAALLIKGKDMTCSGLSAESALTAMPAEEALGKCSGTLIDLVKAGQGLMG